MTALMPKKITTVAQAIAPFEKVKTNLRAVVRASLGAKTAAENRLEKAQAAANLAELNETVNIKNADTEITAAESLIQKLDALLSVEPQESEED